MARIRKRVHYSDYRSELAETKALRQGGFEDEYWDEDELVDYRPSSKAKKKYPRGCKGNDGNEHVYTWVPWVFFQTVSPRYEEERCCGCDKRRGFRAMKANDTG